MLELKFIRDNPEEVEEKSRQKGFKVDIEGLLKVDKELRELIPSLEDLQHQRNDLASKVKNSKPTSNEIDAGKKIKDQIAKQEKKVTGLRNQLNELLLTVPNMPLDDVPIGKTEAENKVIKSWGEPKEYDFKPRTHGEIGESLGLIDKTRAAKVAGSRFAYLKGSLVELQFALINFGMSILGDERIIEELITKHDLKLVAKPFVPVLPPALVNTHAYLATGRLNAEEQTYKLADDEMWLNASAEHSLSNMYMNETLPEKLFPIRYVGYSTSFRREAGSYGKDTDGIFRMHQFDKLEIEVFSTPETGLDEHYLLVAIEEYLLQQLDLPYRVILKCTADIGKPNARGIDIDTYMPGQSAFRETHSADYVTDYQARRMKTRIKRQNGQTELVHNNDATVFAMGRSLIAILENNQTKDGHVIIPDVLQKYMGGREQI